MQSTFFIREPKLLREMSRGDLFVPHYPSLQECVCARVSDCDTQWNAELSEDEVAVISCRVSIKEPGYQPPGFVDVLPMDAWVTPVELIERPAFRERMPLDEIPAVVPARVKRFVDEAAASSPAEKGRAEAALHRGERQTSTANAGDKSDIRAFVHFGGRERLAQQIARAVLETLGGELAVRIPINPHPSPAG